MRSPPEAIAALNWLTLPVCAVLAISSIAGTSGCGLGFVEIPPSLSFVIENGTPQTSTVTIAVGKADSRVEGESVSETIVNVPGRDTASGKLVCGEKITLAVVVGGSFGASIVNLSGDGTGTLGFDSETVGPQGERFLLAGEHFSCSETVLIRIVTAEIGEVSVIAPGASFPDPIDSGDVADQETPGLVAFALVNSVESTIQVNVATGSGALASSGGTEVASEFDVRVPPGVRSAGTVACSQEYVIAAAHVQARTTTAEEDTGDGLFAGGGSAIFHSIVLTGAGTGTEGFDSNSLAIRRGRLLQLGTHFECGDTITVVATDTNNQIMLDSEGQPLLDAFGNPIIQYNVGSGTVTVTPGP